MRLQLCNLGKSSILFNGIDDFPFWEETDQDKQQRRTAMYKILIIEDDLAMAQAVQREMKAWGNEAEYLEDFRNVLARFAEYDPHLVLMDITLPFYNGYHWCSEIRKISSVPVIFFTIPFASLKAQTSYEKSCAPPLFDL